MSRLKIKYLLVIVAFCSFGLVSNSQITFNDSLITISHFKVSYAYQVPSFDMAERFGNNSNIGVSFGLKTKKNWYFGLSSSFLFGNNIE